MFRLTYISKSTKTLSDDEMFEILNTARTVNKDLDITGILVRKNDEFFQILEGEESKVRGLYSKICKDSRHFECELLSEKQIDERNFSDWEMAFVSLDGVDLSNIDGFSNFMNEDTNIRLFKELDQSQRALSLFKDLNSDIGKKMINIALM